MTYIRRISTAPDPAPKPSDEMTSVEFFFETITMIAQCTYNRY